MKQEENIRVGGRLWVSGASSGSVGHGRIELLERIQATGSISQAARDMHMSYKAAWDAVEAMNNLTDEPLVERSVGGRHGGGTQLTARGRRLIEVYRAAEGEFEGFLTQLGQGIADFDHFYDLMKRLGMKTSARNELAGTIRSLTPGAGKNEVVLDIGDSDELVAIITNTSAENLKLRVGVVAYALIKASWVILTGADGIRESSARNRLCGVVETIRPGQVNAEVTLALPGGKRITAIVTSDSISALGLKQGKGACALIKASHVIVAVGT